MTSAIDTPRVRSLFEILDQQFGEDPHLARGMPTGRVDDIRACRRRGNWDVTVVTDASGAVSVEAHEVAIQRMIAAGANMMTWLAVAAEWQRDWTRTEHAAELSDILKHHAGGSGIALLWEQQLLNTPVPSSAG